MSLVKQQIPLFVLGLVGVLMITDFFVVSPDLRSVVSEIQRWAVVAVAFTVALGVINLTRIHVKRITDKTKGQWYHSAWLLVIMYVTLVIGLAGTVKAPAFMWIFNNLYYPADATIYAMVAFFIARASYRALRIRNLDSAILLIAAFVVLIRNTPILVYFWNGFVYLDNWVENVLSASASRGITITIALGLILLGLKTLLGREKASIGVSGGS